MIQRIDTDLLPETYFKIEDARRQTIFIGFANDWLVRVSNLHYIEIISKPEYETYLCMDLFPVYTAIDEPIENYFLVRPRNGSLNSPSTYSSDSGPISGWGWI